MVQKFGQKAPQLQRVDKTRWAVERTGQVLTLALNQRGTVVVVDDGGLEVNRVPLAIYLKGVQNGLKVGGMSGSRALSASRSRTAEK